MSILNAEYIGAPFRYISPEVDMEWYGDYMRNRDNAVRHKIVENGTDKILRSVSLTNIDTINCSVQFHIIIGCKENQNRGIGIF